jgi:AcrR family transcriptional regulator
LGDHFLTGIANVAVVAGVTGAGAGKEFNPFLPITTRAGGIELASLETRVAQRMRRSQILATIRRHLTERGLEGVTVRGVTESCGHAVQTFYNLVGPRERAIIDAVSEYTRFVGRAAQIQPSDPCALIKIINCWLQSIDAQPEFCRQVSLIFFSDARSIYYEFRDGQLFCMTRLLIDQQRAGVVRGDVNVRDLAEQLVLLSSALCLEWSDRPFPIEQLHCRLRAGFECLLANKLADDAMQRIGGSRFN